MAAPPFSPPGSDVIAAWARQRGFAFAAFPDAAWFEAWEPYDTMVAPEAYFDATSFSIQGAGVTLAEPWLAPLGSEPLGRAVLCFLQHPAFVRRAAARGGEHFNTRVAYLDHPPPPRVTVGLPFLNAERTLADATLLSRAVDLVDAEHGIHRGERIRVVARVNIHLIAAIVEEHVTRLGP